MTLLIGSEGIIEAAGILLSSRTGLHILLFVGGRDKTQFHQTAGHGGKPQHSQIVLMGTHIGTPRSLTHITLHILGQFGAILHILVLHELKHDVALGRIEIQAAIELLVISLLEDHGVLTLSHLEVLHHARHLTRPAATA